MEYQYRLQRVVMLWILLIVWELVRRNVINHPVCLEVSVDESGTLKKRRVIFDGWREHDRWGRELRLKILDKQQYRRLPIRPWYETPLRVYYDFDSIKTLRFLSHHKARATLVNTTSTF